MKTLSPARGLSAAFFIVACAAVVDAGVADPAARARDIEARMTDAERVVLTTRSTASRPAAAISC